MGDKSGEGNAYGNLGNAYHGSQLKVAKVVGDKAGEGKGLLQSW